MVSQLRLAAMMYIISLINIRLFSIVPFCRPVILSPSNQNFRRSSNFKTNGWRYVSMKHLGGCCELHASHRDAVDFLSSKLEVLPLVTLVLCPKVGPYNRKSGSVGVEIKNVLVRGFHHVSSFLYCFSGLVDASSVKWSIESWIEGQDLHRKGQHIFFQFASSCLHSSIETFHADYMFLGRSGSKQHHEHSKEKGARAVASPCSAEKSSKALGGFFLTALSCFLTQLPQSGAEAFTLRPFGACPAAAKSCLAGRRAQPAMGLLDHWNTANLAGPPGLGKTATVQALAKATGRRLSDPKNVEQEILDDSMSPVLVRIQLRSVYASFESLQTRLFGSSWRLHEAPSESIRANRFARDQGGCRCFWYWFHFSGLQTVNEISSNVADLKIREAECDLQLPWVKHLSREVKTSRPRVPNAFLGSFCRQIDCLGWTF